MKKPKRELMIKMAITELSGNDFENFAIDLLKREYYPAIIQTSASHDGGADAVTLPSVITLQNGKRVSVAASKTGTWTKLRDDCRTHKASGEQLDIFAFATSAEIREDKKKEWKKKVKKAFGWKLEVHTVRNLVPIAAISKHEKFIYDRLGIPPIGGDFLEDIQAAFRKETTLGRTSIRIQLPGLDTPLPRDEVEEIKSQLQKFSPVLLLGKGGEGKTGIIELLIRSISDSFPILYLDARRLSSITNSNQFKDHFGFDGNVAKAIEHIASQQGCLIIGDQLDNIADGLAGDFLIEFLAECSSIPNTMVVAISRRPLGDERDFLEPLSGFVSLECRELGDAQIRNILARVGLTNPPDQVIDLGRNLLNLSFILALVKSNQKIDMNNLQDEVDLWEQYRLSIVAREGDRKNGEAHNVVVEAVKLARRGLKSTDRTFILPYPPEPEHRRLVRRGVIYQISSRKYRFKHEKLQDYLYAWNAARINKPLSNVLEDIGSFRAQSIIVWINKLLKHTSPEQHAKFLKSVFELI